MGEWEREGEWAYCLEEEGVWVACIMIWFLVELMFLVAWKCVYVSY